MSIPKIYTLGQDPPSTLLDSVRSLTNNPGPSFRNSHMFNCITNENIICTKEGKKNLSMTAKAGGKATKKHTKSPSKKPTKAPSKPPSKPPSKKPAKKPTKNHRR